MVEYNINKNELWAPIKGYEGLYEISSFGRVKNIVTGNYLKGGLWNNGYCRVRLTKNGIGKCKAIHRLVAIAFIPNPNNYPQINHKDEDKTNNCVDNLEWCTQKYNNGYGSRGKKLSDANKRRPKELWDQIARKNTGKKRSPETRKILRDQKLGAKASDETKEKMSKAHKGKKFSETHKENLSKALSGKKNPMYGRGSLVGQFTMDGELINTFISGLEASKALGISSSCIYRCLNGKQDSSLGFVWRRM